MRYILSTGTWAMLFGTALLTIGCTKEEEETPSGPTGGTWSLNTVQNGNVVTVKDSTNQNFTFTNDRTWLLWGFVKVQNGATLTIEPGTIIKGDKATKATLVIERGAKIIAEGTAAQPIVFTSNEPPGQRNYGDWGGLIICGKAPNNAGANVLLEGGTGATFGGSLSDDNSGILRYVRIEFPGIAYQVNNEINGLTLGAVGSGTTMDHIQVSYSGDDSYEWFGGSVNASHLVAFRGWDDDFDTDNGYAGRVQFGVALRDPAIADPSGSNGVESDNDASGSSSAPVTSPIFSNISLYGPLTVDPNTGNMNTLFKRGAHLRRNTRLSLYNSVIAGWPTDLLLDGGPTGDNVDAGLLQVRNTHLAAWGTIALDTVSGAGLDPISWFGTAGWGNAINSDLSSLGLPTPFSLAVPSFRPNGGSALLSGADFSSTNLVNPFFTPVSHKGAFGGEDWTSGWCNWDPQNTVY